MPFVICFVLSLGVCLDFACQKILDVRVLDKTYRLVQFSVHIDGLFGELGPANVSPHRIPLHALICKLDRMILYWIM